MALYKIRLISYNVIKNNSKILNIRLCSTHEKVT